MLLTIGQASNPDVHFVSILSAEGLETLATGTSAGAGVA